MQNSAENFFRHEQFNRKNVTLYFLFFISFLFLVTPTNTFINTKPVKRGNSSKTKIKRGVEERDFKSF